MWQKLLSTVLVGALGVAGAVDIPRGASITHTGEYYINRGYCSYTFLLDNGNMGGAFEDLEILLNHRDIFGRSIGQSTLSVEAFGDSNATRRQSASLEIPCEEMEGHHEFEVIKVFEMIGGKRHELPLHLFQGENPQLAQVSVAASSGYEAIHPAFLGTWVTDPELCHTPEIAYDAHYILTFSGNMARIVGWQYARTETFTDLNYPNSESSNGPTALGGWVNFTQFAPDYSYIKGYEESLYRINDEGRLTIDGYNPNFSLMKCGR